MCFLIGGRKIWSFTPKLLNQIKGKRKILIFYRWVFFTLNAPLPMHKCDKHWQYLLFNVYLTFLHIFCNIWITGKAIVFLFFRWFSVYPSCIYRIKLAQCLSAVGDFVSMLLMDEMDLTKFQFGTLSLLSVFDNIICIHLFKLKPLLNLICFDGMMESSRAI